LLEFGSFELDSFELGSFELGSFELGSFELGSFELGSFELASFELDSFELGSFELGLFKLGSFELASFELGSFDRFHHVPRQVHFVTSVALFYLAKKSAILQTVTCLRLFENGNVLLHLNHALVFYESVINCLFFIYCI
jgi:hypothetical protein